MRPIKKIDKTEIYFSEKINKTISLWHGNKEKERRQKLLTLEMKEETSLHIPLI